MKAKTKYLKATKVARIENLIFSGFNLKADFFTLTCNQLTTLKDCMEADNYRYISPLGRSTLRCYWYSLQRVYNKISKQ